MLSQLSPVHRAAVVGVLVLIATLFTSGCYLLDISSGERDVFEESVPLWRQPDFSSRGFAGVDSDAAYFVGTDGTLRKLRRSDGVEQWRMTGIAGDAMPLASRVGSSLIVEPGPLLAIDPRLGQEFWRSGAPDGHGQLPFGSDRVTLFPSTYQSRSGEVIAIAPDQTLRWRTSLIPQDSSVPADEWVRAFTPATRDGIVAYTFVWWRQQGNSVLPTGGVAMVEAASGRLRWSRMLPVRSPGSNTSPSDPVIDARHVYVSSREGQVYAFSVLDGSLAWTGEPEQVPDDRALAIIEDVLIVGSGRSRLAAHDATSGRRLWSKETISSGTLQIHPFQSYGALVSNWGGDLSLYHVRTGRLLWSRNPSRESERLGRVTVVGDTIFASSIAGGAQAFRLVKK